MKQFLLQVFTWWNGQTMGTRFHTWRNGERVGADEFGNVYYRSRGGRIDPALGHERRWVVYNGQAEASAVPPGWNGWLHHTVDVPPSEESYVPREWQKPHQQNLTGTPQAYRPTGSAVNAAAHPKAKSTYSAWTPGS
jgi:NADH:ubiquinone oxidoreductase subunit